MKELTINWTAEEIEDCSDIIDGQYRFVSVKHNPNNKDYYNTVLYRKLEHVTINDKNSDWHILGYKGFEKGFITIYVLCPHKTKTKLNFDAVSHAPKSELSMKWSTDCKLCFEKATDNFDQYEVVIPNHQQVIKIPAPPQLQQLVPGTSGNLKS